MKLNLSYVLPDGSVINTGLWNKENDVMLQRMVDENPDVNFFFVTDTTDIWEDPMIGRGDYSRMFGPHNSNWMRDSQANAWYLKGVQAHMNNLLQVHGVVLLNEVYQALGMERSPQGAVVGWARDNDAGDGYVDFGIFDSDNEDAKAFLSGESESCLLRFNIDGVVVNHLQS